MNRYFDIVAFNVIDLVLLLVGNIVLNDSVPQGTKL